MNPLKRWLLLAAVVFVGTLTAPAQEKAPPRKASPIPEGTKVLKDIAYGPHERNKLDLYLPPADGPLPLVVWVHGGGWEKGSKDGAGPSLDLLRQGYAVASINYRLSPQAVFPAQIVDCKAAIRHLRSVAAEYHLDTDHVGVWGASAGGHLVALLGTTGDADFADGSGDKKYSSTVQAVCDWFGPADFLHWGQYDLSHPGDGRPNPITRLLGGLVVDKQELAKQASPVAHVSKSCAPFFIAHGDHDPLVPLQQSESLNEALKKAGVEATLVVVKGAGHGGPGFAARDLFGREEAFFAKHLKPKAAAK
ncbi:MAG TPA: alpha/beta hydrolase [Gemmataceae bacterium]|jgi:acetyl esterase/lipase